MRRARRAVLARRAAQECRRRVPEFRWLRLATFVVAFVAFAAPVTALAACVKTTLMLSAGGFHQLIQDEGGFRYYRTVTLPDGTRAKRWVPYEDSKGYCTVGHGHLIGPPQPCTSALVKKWTLTNAQADALLLTDVQSRVTKVNQLLTRAVTQAQFDALVNFVYNAGAGKPAYRTKSGRLRKPGLIGSGILAAVNGGDDRLAGQLILRYVSKQERLTSKGLISRRDREATPFLTTRSVACPPTAKPPPPNPPPVNPTNPTSPPTAPPSSVRVQVDLYRMVFNNGSVQGAGTVTSEPAGISCSVSRDFAATAPAVSGTCAASFAGGTHLTLTATADPQSSVFHGWSNADGQQATAGDPCYVQGTGPCVLTLGASGGYEIGASFGLQTRVLTIDNPDQSHGEVLASAPTGGQQAICGVEDEQCSVVYPFGQPVIVDANGQNPPITGYGLGGCDAPFPGTMPCEVTMTADKTLAVNWIE